MKELRLAAAGTGPEVLGRACAGSAGCSRLSAAGMLAGGSLLELLSSTCMLAGDGSAAALSAAGRECGTLARLCGFRVACEPSGGRPGDGLLGVDARAGTLGAGAACGLLCSMPSGSACACTLLVDGAGSAAGSTCCWPPAVGPSSAAAACQGCCEGLGGLSGGEAALLRGLPRFFALGGDACTASSCWGTAAARERVTRI